MMRDLRSLESHVEAASTLLKDHGQNNNLLYPEMDFLAGWEAKQKSCWPRAVGNLLSAGGAASKELTLLSQSP